MAGLGTSGGRSAVLAATLYLLLAMWWMQGVLAAPATQVMGVPRGNDAAGLSDTDQRMVLSQIVRHARLFGRPADLAREGQCFPTPWSYTLGEHMFGNALLAALPLAISGDPIVAFNAVLLLNIFVAAMAMYAFTAYATGSVAAALVAGVLFGFGQTRLTDPSHPYVMGGDLWTPLLLLFLLKVFADGTWRSAAGLAVFSCLQLGESLYAVLAAMMLALSVTTYLVVRDPRRFVAITPRLLVAALPVLVVTWLVFDPYLATAATWGGMTRSTTFFAPLGAFAVGGPYFPGVVVTLLAIIALLDRVRGPRPAPAGDVRLVILAAGLLVFLSAVGGVRVLGLPLPSPLQILRRVVPGLDAVRVLAAVRIGCYAALAILAGFGVAALGDRLSRRGVAVLAALLCVTALLEIAMPRFATFSFGQPVLAEAVRMRPDESDIELITRTADGPVLDLPNRKPYLVATSSHLLLGAWHGRPSAACYNSFGTPIQAQIERRSARLPVRAAAEELAALGFRTVYVHRRFLEQGFHAHQIAAMARAAARPESPLKAVASSATIDAYRLTPSSELHTDVAALSPVHEFPGAAAEAAVVTGPRAKLTFPIVNPRQATFVLPGDPAPSELVVTWRRRADGATHEQRLRALLPLAIAALSRADLELELDVPGAPGIYDVLVAPATSPGRPLSRTSVRVRRGRP